LAKCWEQIGKTASAWALFSRVAEEASAAGQTDRAQLASARAKLLEPRPARLEIDVEAQDPALVVWRDQTQVEHSGWGTAAPLDPGEHEISALAPGKKRFVLRVSVPVKGTISVLIPKLADDAPPAPPAHSEPLPPTLAAPASIVERSAPPPPQAKPSRAVGPASTKPGSHQALMWTLGSVGAVGAAVSVYFVVSFKRELDEAESACPNLGFCDVDQYHSHRDKAVTDGRLAYVGYAVTGTAVAALLVTYLSVNATPAPQTGWRVVPECSVAVCGALLSRSW
jgi:hypothetical protein